MTMEIKDMSKTYEAAIKTSLAKKSSEPITKAVGASNSDEDTKKIWLDIAFRDFLTTNCQGKESNLKYWDDYIQLCIDCAKANFCPKTTPIAMMSDLFEVITLDHCENLFSTIEKNIILWKSEEFFTPIRNNLLRICNDLLRRLSRSQNTVFCGRILLFLAKFFPVSERSGLNVVSEFNLENTTVYNSAEEAADENGSLATSASGEKPDEAMEVDSKIKLQPDQKSLSVDYALYAKFWQLQDFFRNPNQCYTNLKWKTFSTYSLDVLNTFKSFKVDAISGKHRKSAENLTREEQYFAKYLTNQNLLQLQLSDSNFRRYILIQFLILFQYLKSSVKFKSESFVLTDDQSKWIEKTETKIFELMGETPPYGDNFAKSVKHILHREEQWNLWKNQGCPPLTSKAEETPKKSEESKDSNAATTPNSKITGTTRKRKMKLGDAVQKQMKVGKFLMGNKVLTDLWNRYPDNMQACSAPERDFLPVMDEYFKEAIEQLDPSNQIESDYKKVNDGQWGWRALRLLAKKSPHFFTYGNNPIAKLPDYLDSILKKMYPESVKASPSSNGTKESSKEEDSNPPEVCTKEQLSKIAENLGDKWPKLIPKLGLTADDEEKFKKDGKTDKEQAEAMLAKWAEMEGEGATREEITYSLERLKLKDALEGVFD